MADEVDIANTAIQQQEVAAMTYRKPQSCITPSGWCHQCGEEVPLPKLFCNGECARKFEVSK